MSITILLLTDSCLPLDTHDRDVSAQSGVLFFPDLAKLRTQPNGQDYCVADYSPNRIVFHIENKSSEVVAVVSSFTFTSSVLNPNDNFVFKFVRECPTGRLLIEGSHSCADISGYQPTGIWTTSVKGYRGSPGRIFSNTRVTKLSIDPRTSWVFFSSNVPNLYLYCFHLLKNYNYHQDTRRAYMSPSNFKGISRLTWEDISEHES